MSWSDLGKYIVKNTFDILFYALVIAVLMLPCWGTMVVNAWVNTLFP
jgi:hypothetical protein